jgi:hypothetical protein
MSSVTLGAGRRNALAFLAIALVVLLAVWWGWRTLVPHYPYGWSHSCDSGMMMLLRQYADDHNDAYPAGQASPEASLSLLFPRYFDNDPEAAAEWLRGKTVPRDVVRDKLSRGELLTPDTCGWHYVEGLTVRDDPRLALLWDKVGLGHNGQRLRHGGHYVVFVRGLIEYIPGDQWDSFLAEQQRLLAARKPKK